VHDLALQVGQVDLVVVDQGDAADAARCQVERGGRTEAAGTDDEGVRVEQALLALDAELVQQDVARIAQELGVVHRTGPIISWPAP
jgi:hypothetical protein